MLLTASSGCVLAGTKIKARWPSFFGYFRPHLYGCWYGVLKPYQSVYPGVCALECPRREIYIQIKSICVLVYTDIV